MNRYWLASILLVSSCGSTHKEGASNKAATTVSVSTDRVSLGRAAQTAQATGTVQPRTRTVISAQVAGLIRQVLVEPGQSVQAGQTLVLIDSQQLLAGESQAAAARLEATGGLAESERAIDSARTQLDLAKSTRARLKTLYDKRSLSSQEMDEANSRLSQAASALAIAEARRAQVNARIAQSDQALKSAQLTSRYATLTAPFAGIVSEKLAQVGALAVPGAPLLVIEKAGGFRLEMNVEESRSSQIRLGMPLRVVLEQGEAVDAKVSEIVPSLDPASRSLTVKVDLPPLKALRSGAFARGEWVTGERELLSVAPAAVRESGQMQMVFVVEGGRAHSRMISVGDAQAGRREVLTGLKSGEVVVLNPPLDFHDGTPVEVAK